MSRKMKNSFDSKGNLIETVDDLKRKTSFEYNEMGKPIRITRPDKSVVEMEYDKRGNMTLRNDGETQMRCEYDELNRPVKINDTQYSYNDNSKIEKIVNPDGSWEKYKYNSVGKVTEKATSEGVTIKNEYNDMNLLTKITDAKGTTRLDYDKMWNVSKKIDIDGNETTYKYNCPPQKPHPEQS